MADRLLRTLPALALVIGSLPWVVMSLVPFSLLSGWPPISLALRVGLVVMALGLIWLALLDERGRSLTLPLAALAGVGLLAEAAGNIAILMDGPWFGTPPLWDGPTGWVAATTQAAFALAALRARVLPRLPLIGVVVFSLVIVVAPFLGPLPLSFWAMALLPLAWLSLGLAILLAPAAFRVNHRTAG